MICQRRLILKNQTVWGGGQTFPETYECPLRSIPLPSLPIPLGNRPFIGLIFYPLGLATNLQYRVKEKWESLSVISQARA